ncbi:MAG: hypothetical protein HY822_03835, partial [Acidobacteria bacterium]|nr:hypothetical protein [Acidobacteriota bacterium]
MARLLRGVIAMAGLAALPAAPECRTPLGVPCSTIRFQHSQWQFLRDGAPAFSHSTWTSIEAARGDGSSAVITEGGNYRQWFKTETRAAGAASLYLAEEDRVVHVDHAQKTVRRRAPMMWT